MQRPSRSNAQNAVLACLLCVPTLVAQNQRDPPHTAPTFGANEYHEVLNRLFPIPADHGRDIVFKLTLRTTPAFDAESQIDIVLHREQGQSVQYSFVTQNVDSTCNKLLETAGTQSPEVLASKIPVTRKSLNVSPKQILRWQQEFLAGVTSSLPSLSEKAQGFFTTGKTVVMLDGTSFDLWYAQELTTLNIGFGEGLKKGTLLTWAHGLYQEVVRLADSK
jgi:hypothetical protein